MYELKYKDTGSINIEYYELFKDGEKISDKSYYGFLFSVNRLTKEIAFINAKGVEHDIDVNNLINAIIEMKECLDIEYYSVDDDFRWYKINGDLKNLWNNY